MELNAENMYLLALVETLKKENDTLKKEKVVILQKLESVEKSVSRLNAKLLERIETKQDNEVAEKKLNLTDQLKKIQNIAYKLVKVSGQKCKDEKTSKMKYGKLCKPLGHQDKKFNETSTKYPLISQDNADSMIDHIWQQPNTIQSVKPENDLETAFIEFRPQYTIPAIKLNTALTFLNIIEKRRIPPETVIQEPKCNKLNFSYEYLTELSQSIYPYHLIY